MTRLPLALPGYRECNLRVISFMFKHMRPNPSVALRDVMFQLKSASFGVTWKQVRENLRFHGVSLGFSLLLLLRFRRDASRLMSAPSSTTSEHARENPIVRLGT